MALDKRFLFHTVMRSAVSCGIKPLWRLAPCSRAAYVSPRAHSRETLGRQGHLRRSLHQRMASVSRLPPWAAQIGHALAVVPTLRRGRKVVRLVGSA